jgi:hypothetical protein
MRRLSLWLLAAAAVAVLASPALAQRGRGGFRMPTLMLLNQESVQKELKLSKEQTKKVKAAAAKQMEAFQGLRDVDEEERPKKIQEIMKEGDKAVKDILKKDQAKRFKQITLQVQGPQAFADDAVAKELKLTADQKKKIKTLLSDAQEKRQEAFQDAAGDFQAAQKKVAEINKETTEKVMKELTDDQKTTWKKMIGKKFEGKLSFGPPRRRGGGQ